LNSAQQLPLASTLQPAFPRLTRALLALLVFAGLVGRVFGQTYTGPDNLTGNGFGNPSSFIWNTSTLNPIWNTRTNGGDNGQTSWVNWTSGDATPNNASLNSTTSALTLTLGEAISVGSITANTGIGGSWTIANDSNNLTINTGSTTNASLTLNGGTLFLATAGTYTFNTITITGNTTLDFGGTIGTTLQSTNLTIQNNAIVTVNNWVANTDLWKSTNAPSVNGSTIASGGTVTGVNFTNYSGLTTSWTSSGVTANQLYPVPEPSTYGAIMAAGCAGLIGWRRRRSRREAAAKA
jgi:hypothetical protein